MGNKSITGPGSIGALPDLLRALNEGNPRRNKTAIIVSGGFDSRPWSEAIRKMVGSASSWHVHQGSVTPDSVALLARELRHARADVVLAIGGGSVLDAAKASLWLSHSSRIDAPAVVAACTGKIASPSTPIPLVAVPTTPGTGSEVTPFATVWQAADNRKLSLAARDLAPSAVILDPDLLHSLDLRQLCMGLLDTLCQGAEAAWSIRSTAESVSYGLAAVSLVGSIIESLGREQPGDSVLLTLQLAGNLSGQAIARANTSSCHSLSYPLTLRAGLSHGHACGVTFGRILRYNAQVGDNDCADPRGPDHVRQLIFRVVRALGAQDADDADSRVEKFLVRNGLATLHEIPCPLDVVAREALSYPRIADNPRVISHSTLLAQLNSRITRQESCV